MSGAGPSLAAAAARAYAVGASLCVGTPILVSALVLSGAAPAGQQPVEGFYQQTGYLLTGLVFLAASWVWGRTGRALKGFAALPAPQRPAVLLRETLLCSAALEVSCLCGLIYWLLVGAHAGRHVWGFISLTPLLFVALVPRPARWLRSLAG